MKQLLFLLMLLPFMGISQTADYTVSDDDDKFYTYQKGTWVFDLGPDTLVGANDTLIIDIPRNFYDNYEINYFWQVDSIAGQSYNAGVAGSILTSPCVGCVWDIAGGGLWPMNDTGRGVWNKDVDEAVGTRYRVRYINIDDYSQVSVQIVFIPK